MKPASTACPNCAAPGMYVFYELSHVPVHSVMLLPTRQAALDCPRGDIRLAFCPACGFIANLAYNPSLQDYAAGYESTQSYSPTFDAFSRGLASRLVERYDLHGKDIIEIGCGMGEFLSLLCELGGNHGLGFDPSYLPGRLPPTAAGSLRIIPEVYSTKAAASADLIVCKMTLEHIGQPRNLLEQVRLSTLGRPETVLFFQVPEVTRILEEEAFWDIYYEHCSYFSPSSLLRLFLDHGFEALDLRADYEGQYLMIEARPGSGREAPAIEDSELAALAARVHSFENEIGQRLDGWKSYLAARASEGHKIVLWGAGSKAVAFLTTLGVRDELRFCVDINPHKHGAFMAGTGQQIVAPEFLQDYRPDLVIAMNPVYRQEIAASLQRLGLHAELITVNDVLQHSHER